MAARRTWLDVPFGEKDAAKAAGARWDPAARRWYAPRVSPDLDRWAARPALPEVLPGEDRGFGGGLFVDLVPSSCWFVNARSCIAERDWERVRRAVTSRAGRRCEICGATEDRTLRRWLEVHERWDYDPQRLVQSLRRLVCLCTDCHTVTHLGLAQLRGRDVAALDHLMRVTGFGPSDVTHLVEAAFELFAQRSRHTWTLDLSILQDAGVEVVRPPEQR